MKPKKNLVILALAGLCFLAACKVMLIGAYDESTDQGIQKLQTDVTTLLLSIKRNLINGDIAACSYANCQKSYTAIEVEAETLRVRTGALPKYTLVNAQIGLLKKSIEDLETLHKTKHNGHEAFTTINDTTIVVNSLSTLEVGFSAMLTLQNALKSERNK